MFILIGIFPKSLNESSVKALCKALGHPGMCPEMFSHSGAQYKKLEIVSAHKQPTNKERTVVWDWPQLNLTILPDWIILSCVSFRIGIFFWNWMWFPYRKGNSNSFGEITGPCEDCEPLWRLMTEVSVTQPLSKPPFPAVDIMYAKFTGFPPLLHFLSSACVCLWLSTFTHLQISSYELTVTE